MGQAELLTPDEAAQWIGVCTKVLRRLRTQGHIRYVAITERKIRYRPEDCERFIASRVRQQAECYPTNRKGRAKATRGPGKVIPFTLRSVGAR